MSSFFFPYSVFKRLVVKTRKNKGWFGKGLSSSSSRPLTMLVSPNASFWHVSRYAELPVWPKLRQKEEMITGKFGTPRFTLYNSEFSRPWKRGLLRALCNKAIMLEKNFVSDFAKINLTVKTALVVCKIFQLRPVKNLHFGVVCRVIVTFSFNPLLHRYSFWHIKNRQIWKHCGKMRNWS